MCDRFYLQHIKRVSASQHCAHCHASAVLTTVQMLHVHGVHQFLVAHEKPKIQIIQLFFAFFNL